MARITSTIAALGLLAGAAQADVVLSFGFTDTSGSYDGVDTFTATAVDSGLLQTSGDVTRLSAPGGTAEFATGFASGSGDFSVDLSVDNPGSPGETGSFTITDVTGDTITGDISGTWLSGGGDIVFFNGFLSNVFLNDTSGDGDFDGTSGAFGMDIDGQPLEGAFVTLFIATGSGFFDSAFQGVSTQVDGVVIPAPAGVMALAGLGLMAARRRRA